MKEEKQHFTPFMAKLLIAMCIFAVMFTLALLFGAADISLRNILLALTTNQTGDEILIIREIRLPRELGAILVGAALGVSGAIMQGITRNPLADPGLLGLTAGANAALAITMAFFPAVNYLGLTIVCFIGAAVGVALVFGVSVVKRGGFTPMRIVLAGAAVSTFLYALAEGTAIYFKLSKDVSLWTAGGLVGTSWKQLQTIAPFILFGIFVAILFSRQLTILSLSEDVAIGLGQKTARVKAVLFIVIVLLAGAAVALVGNMVFIGLMIPHIVRTFVGTDYRFIIPMSAISGATLMLFADTIGRTISAPYETPVVAIIAIIGLPFFLFIVRKGGKAFS